jgi:cobalt/nickel transport system ATP-binding protein
MEPKCLVMDEPSTGLDEEKFSHLVSFLKNTSKSIIVVTHDKELIEELNWQTYRIKNGRLVKA